MPRSRILKITIPIAALCFGLILAEAVLRFFVPIAYFKPAEPIREDLWWTLIHQRSEIPGLPYELRPNVEK